MPKPAQEQVEAWKAQYGDVYELTGETDDGSQRYQFVFRKPGRAALSRFAREVMGDALKALHNLVFECLLYPDADAVRRLFEEKPGMAIAVGSELQKLVGTNQDFFVKRL